MTKPSTTTTQSCSQSKIKQNQQQCPLTKLLSTLNPNYIIASDNNDEPQQQQTITNQQTNNKLSQKKPPPTPTPAQTLDGRLLCASQCAYAINATEPYFKSVGYLPGTTAKRLTRTINSALVGRTVDGIVVSFRGTQTSSPLDWLQNAGVFLKTVDSSEGGGSNNSRRRKIRLPGKIHSGFYGAVKSLWSGLVSEVTTMMADDEKDETRPKGKLYFTGHSKGGALASIAALLFQMDDTLPNVTYVCTFASARVGNSDFRDEYNRRVNQTTYESYLDIIPFLPPSSVTMESMDEDMADMVEGLLWSNPPPPMKKKYIWDYQPVGRRRYIDENGTIQTNITKKLDDERIRDIEKKTLLSFKKFAAAHCAGCPSLSVEEEESGGGGNCDGRYFKSVAGDVCKQCMS